MSAPKGHTAYEGSETGGRPLKYTPEFIENEAVAFELWMQNSENVYFKKFAVSRGYHPQRLSEFAEQSEKFSEAYKRAKAWQEIKLVEGGLKNTFNAGFTKFVLINTAGWSSEKSQHVDPDSEEAIIGRLIDSISNTSRDLVVEGQNGNGI
jgi:hypothetical protein